MGEETKEGRAAEKPDEAEMMARLQQEIRNLPVSDHLLYMMHSLSALAVDRMGMAPADAARRDLAQASMAIDAFKALMEIVERVRPAKEMTAHKGVLAELQLAYVAALDQGTKAAGEEGTSGTQSEPPIAEDEERVEQAEEAEETAATDEAESGTEGRSG